MDTLHSRCPQIFVLLKLLFSLKNKTKRKLTTSLEPLLSSPTPSSPLQVYLSLQSQVLVLYKRIGALDPKEEIVL